MNDVMIEVDDLSIRYSTLGRSGRWSRRRLQHVDAVRNVSFTINRGESVGFIGGNGAGKSTLLRAIAGTCAPTSGRVLVREQPWILGVQASLMPRLTGHQNIEIGLLSLGLSPAEVRHYAPKVADFSNLGIALSRPLNTYSSGMGARLKFSIATVKRPEILLLDEALAVGDLDFKRRSIRRLNTICGNASTLLIVSHNSREIKRTCARTIWMSDGRIVADGPTDEVVDAYDNSESDSPDDMELEADDTASTG